MTQAVPRLATLLGMPGAMLRAPWLPPERLALGSVRRVLQKPAVAGGHGVLVMCDVTDPGKVARHDHEGCYARNV